MMEIFNQSININLLYAMAIILGTALIFASVMIPEWLCHKKELQREEKKSMNKNQNGGGIGKETLFNKRETRLNTQYSNLRTKKRKEASNG